MAIAIVTGSGVRIGSESARFFAEQGDDAIAVRDADSNPTLFARHRGRIELVIHAAAQRPTTAPPLIRRPPDFLPLVEHGSRLDPSLDAAGSLYALTARCQPGGR